MAAGVINAGRSCRRIPKTDAAGEYSHQWATDFVRDCAAIPVDERQQFIAETREELTEKEKPASPKVDALVDIEPEEEVSQQKDTSTKPERLEPEGDDDSLPMPDFAGYSVDRWFRVHGGKKRGRKAGPLTPFHYYKPDGTFIHGYQMSVDGERRKVSQATIAKQRHKAVRRRINRSEIVL